MQLSKKESQAYEELQKNNIHVFTIEDLMKILNLKKEKAYYIVKALKKKKIIKSLKVGTYAFKDVDERILGAYAHWPSYISFISALNYYGYSDNLPQKITYVTTKYTKKLKDFTYIYVSPKCFFGYLQIGDIIIANREKTFIDALKSPKYALGVKHIQECFKKALPEINSKTLIKYALQVNIKSVVRRLGWLLEEEGIFSERLHKQIGKGYEILDPSIEKKNNFNKKWLLDVNI